MKVGDKFLCGEADETIEIVDKYFNPMYGEVVYDLRFNNTNTVLHGILRKTIMELIRKGLARPCNRIEPIKSLKRLKLHP